MNNPPVHPTKKSKIAVITGAGISAESGLATFRDSNGLWAQHNIEDVASIDGWHRNPKLVLDFYNARREQAASAAPNAAHLALIQLEREYDVCIITQNVDDLHERAGSSHIIHLHGQLNQARSSRHPHLISHIGTKAIHVGDQASDGSPLRPNIVWFGEAVPLMETAMEIVSVADKVLVIGTSLSVYPAAALVDEASTHADKVLVSLDVATTPIGYDWIKAPATIGVPAIVQKWTSCLTTQ
jgi:NAD-dependent deacetylase